MFCSGPRKMQSSRSCSKVSGLPAELRTMTSLSSASKLKLRTVRAPAVRCPICFSLSCLAMKTAGKVNDKLTHIGQHSATLESRSMSKVIPRYWPSARHFTEAIRWPGVCFSDRLLRETQPAGDRLGMPLVTSGQFAYVYKLKSGKGGDDFAVRCFRGYLGDRDQRYRAIQAHIQTHQLPFLSGFTYAPEGILVGGNR